MNAPRRRLLGLAGVGVLGTLAGRYRFAFWGVIGGAVAVAFDLV